MSENDQDAERIAAISISRYLEALESDAGASANDYCPANEGAAELFRRAQEGLEALRPADEERGVEGGGVAASKRFPRIDGYRIVRELGRGGMGVVFEAEQLEPRRRVAIKVVRDASSASRIRRRLFRREVALLAELQHPNIAAIYGAGETVEGTPYFAMERIEGRPLDSTKGSPTDLTFKESVRLFCQVTDGVHYAHQHAIVHRDLKPSNVLVDDNGRVKILDFGLARTTRRDDSITTTDGGIAGTLSYMSPEQALGDEKAPVDTRGDIYSLGVMLYELVTGALPFDFRGRSALHAIQLLKEHELPLPRSVRADVPRDLEAILLKALASRPEDRYQSVDALRDDLDRFLRGDLVGAKSYSSLDRLKHIVRRHRAPVGALVIAVLAMATFAIVLSSKNRLLERAQLEERQARARAETESRRLLAVNEFLHTLLATADPRLSAKEPTVREVLDKASRQLNEDPPADAAVEADLRRTIGGTYTVLTASLEAVPHLRRGWELLNALGRTKDVRDMQVLLDLASCVSVVGDGEEASRYLNEWLDWSVTQDSRDPLVGESLYRAAIMLVDRLEFARAAPIVDELIRESATQFGDHDVLVEGLRLLRVRIAMGLGKKEDAATECDVILNRLRTADTSDGREVSAWGLQLASLLSLLGRPTDADEVITRTLPAMIERFGEDHELVANAFHMQSRIAMQLGQLDEAERLVRRAWEIRKASGGESSLSAQKTRLDVARILSTGGNHQAAYELCQGLGEQLRKSNAPLAVAVQAYVSGSTFAYQAGDIEACMVEARQGSSLAVAGGGTDLDIYPVALVMEASCLMRMRKWDEAVGPLAEAADRFRLNPEREPAWRSAMTMRLSALESLGRFGEASEVRADLERRE